MFLGRDRRRFTNFGVFLLNFGTLKKLKKIGFQVKWTGNIFLLLIMLNVLSFFSKHILTTAKK